MVRKRKMMVSVLVVLVLAVSIGGVLSSGMMMERGGAMQNCPFMGVSAFCNMNALEHAAALQQMFSVVPQEVTTLLLVLLLFFAFFRNSLQDIFVRKRPVPAAILYNQREVIFVSGLRLALARGIIHPKVF